MRSTSGRTAAATATATAAVLATALLLSPSASAQVPPYGTNDFGGFRNVLPPGTNGLDNVLQLLAFETTGARPPHNSDQLAMYSRPCGGGIGPPLYFRAHVSRRRGNSRKCGIFSQSRTHSRQVFTQCQRMSSSPPRGWPT